MDTVAIIHVTDWFDTTGLSGFAGRYFPFPEITVPLLVLVGIIVTAKVTSAILKMVTGGLAG